MESLLVGIRFFLGREMVKLGFRPEEFEVPEGHPDGHTQEALDTQTKTWKRSGWRFGSCRGWNGLPGCSGPGEYLIPTLPPHVCDVSFHGLSGSKLLGSLSQASS